ncbi:MAG: response regulator [Balneolaceae bacterium]
MNSTKLDMLNKIMCVEDDHLLQLFFNVLVEQADFAEEIIPVFNGREALSYYKDLLNSAEEPATDSPDLIFLDLNMPVMGGLEFLNEFEKQFLDYFPMTGIVILTSSADPAEMENVKQRPMVLDYLAKPLSYGMLDDLKQAVITEKGPYGTVTFAGS